MMVRKRIYAQNIVAKRATRKYHGQGLTEGVFKTQLYSPRFNVVAGGKESERRQLWGGLYCGVERRLDTVVFRSLFATSIQQARQLVIHGHVEVNGRPVYSTFNRSNLQENRPGVLLRPGDIYHANPQIVKRFISAEFHEKHLALEPYRRQNMESLRNLYLRKQGLSLENILRQRPPYSDMFEYDPYMPIEQQGRHPMYNFLDKQAQREENYFRSHEKFSPKPFMAPNVFLPAYLEVSYRSCTGCFVRLPQIKRDGSMEIPSPFPPDVHERAGMFYSRYGRGVIRRQRGYRGYKLLWNKRQKT
jgi:small subunit ribosomal protein S4